MEKIYLLKYDLKQIQKEINQIEEDEVDYKNSKRYQELKKKQAMRYKQLEREVKLSNERMQSK